MSSVSEPIRRVQEGLSPLELIYISHPRWPIASVDSEGKYCDTKKGVYRVSVLDSSFNPPTLAHFALAKAPAVQPLVSGDPSETGKTGYDAKLLLLSVRNADKQLTPGDATYVQRLDMMTLLAKDLEHSGRVHGEDENVAVAIIDEPTFVGKSKVLIHFLRGRLSLELPATTEAVPAQSQEAMPMPRVQLTFLVGMDTLERMFAPRYYGSEEQMLTSLRRFLSHEGDDAWVVCARRITPARSTEEEREHERALLETTQKFVDSGRVTLIDIGEDEQTISSTSIRNSRRRGDSQWQSYVTRSVSEYIEQQDLYYSP